MNFSHNYNGYKIAVKGRMTAGLTTAADVGGCNILLNQGGLLDTPALATLSSSSASDAGAGAGAQQITLYGLGEDKLYQEEVVTLNGQTVVDSAKKWYRVFTSVANRAGTTGYNVGDIYIIKKGTGGTYTAGVPGVVTAASMLQKMLAGSNQGPSCFYTTPNLDAGKWLPTGLFFCGRAQIGTAFVQIQDWANGTPFLRGAYVDIPAGGDVFIDLRPYKLECGPLTDIRVLALGASAGLIAAATLFIEETVPGVFGSTL